MDPEIRKKYDSLPKAIKDALTSVDLSMKIQEIGKKHFLHIDKMESLLTITTNVLLGYLHTDDLASEIEAVIEVPISSAINIAADLNLEVFLPLRESLKEMDSADSEVRGEPLGKSNFVSQKIQPERSDILREIENPTPTVHPISSVSQIKSNPKEGGEQTPGMKNTAAKEFVAGKLSEAVNMPAQRTSFNVVSKDQKKPGWTEDPYREKIN